MKSRKSDGPSQTRAAAATRKRLERDRMRKAGYVLRQIWVRPAEWPAIQKYLNRQNRQRS
jgi:hypothetical protein